jgi:tetratricopeptide (TPR) repeat protein
MGRVVSISRAAFAGSALTFSFCLLAVWSTPLKGQLLFGNPYDAGISPSHTHTLPWNRTSVAPDVFDNFPPPPRVTPPAATVSSDVLRHPLSEKELHLLQKIAHLAELGKHTAAIEALQEALLKHPSAKPYLDSMLGAEYLNTNQLAAAVASFGEAVRIMPHEAGTHSNLGLSLALTGHFDMAEKELSKALELDKNCANAKTILEAMRVAERNAYPKQP